MELDQWGGGNEQQKNLAHPLFDQVRVLDTMDLQWESYRWSLFEMQVCVCELMDSVCVFVCVWSVLPFCE